VHDRGPAATARVVVSFPATANSDVKAHAAGDVYRGANQGTFATAFFSASTATSSNLNLDLGHPGRDSPFVLGIRIRGIEVETDLLIGEGRWCCDD